MTAYANRRVFGIGEVNVMEMLHEVIATVERPLSFWFSKALLILVSCHVNIVGIHLAAEVTRQQGCVLGVAANPCCPKCVY